MLEIVAKNQFLSQSTGDGRAADFSRIFPFKSHLIEKGQSSIAQESFTTLDSILCWVMLGTHFARGKFTLDRASFITDLHVPLNVPQNDFTYRRGRLRQSPRTAEEYFSGETEPQYFLKKYYVSSSLLLKKITRNEHSFIHYSLSFEGSR